MPRDGFGAFQRAAQLTSLTERSLVGRPAVASFASSAAISLFYSEELASGRHPALGAQPRLRSCYAAAKRMLLLCSPGHLYSYLRRGPE